MGPCQVGILLRTGQPAWTTGSQTLGGRGSVGPPWAPSGSGVESGEADGEYGRVCVNVESVMESVDVFVSVWSVLRLMESLDARVSQSLPILGPAPGMGPTMTSQPCPGGFHLPSEGRAQTEMPALDRNLLRKDRQAWTCRTSARETPGPAGPLSWVGWTPAEAHVVVWGGGVRVEVEEGGKACTAPLPVSHLPLEEAAARLP
ncbi:hypothetical protein P7K49_002215 [Saguinus oedipus]|uniref:Uncharacterized protein n=1 Tax=Saguinus oedipus TaxID=9490 RepID=A0ABQ9WGQ5_SAGOE|nr:hypothetical protein P7K49_002215 [Saguinus oedipus]